jgi:hypothetical protein
MRGRIRRGDPVAKASLELPANNKTARCTRSKIVRLEKIKNNQKSEESPPCSNHRKDKATIARAHRNARPLAAR